MDKQYICLHENLSWDFLRLALIKMWKGFHDEGCRLWINLFIFFYDLFTPLPPIFVAHLACKNCVVHADGSIPTHFFYDNDKRRLEWRNFSEISITFRFIFSLSSRTMRHHRKMQMAVLVIGSAWTSINHVARRMKITSTRFCGGRVSSHACKIIF